MASFAETDEVVVDFFRGIDKNLGFNRNSRNVPTANQARGITDARAPDRTSPVPRVQRRSVAELELSLNLRLVQSDGLRSYLNGGLGELRFDPQHDGLRLGRARLVYSALWESSGVKFDASNWG